jgi:acyl-coenzyme A synthetase/AMP-(fatty) acid ligase
VLGIREDDIVFSAGKLFLAYELGKAPACPLAVGATTVLMAERPMPAAIFARITQFESPVEVEMVQMQHHDVLEAAVVGMTRDGLVKTRMFVVVKPACRLPTNSL